MSEDNRPWIPKAEVEQQRQQRETEKVIKAAKRELEHIDMAAIRPLRAKLNGNDTEEDRNRLAELEQQAEEQRAIVQEYESSESEDIENA